MFTTATLLALAFAAAVVVEGLAHRGAIRPELLLPRRR